MMLAGMMKQIRPDTFDNVIVSLCVFLQTLGQSVVLLFERPLR